MSTYFHIYNRGANREKIFSNEGNYHFLRRRIKRYLPDYKIALAAYCLMPNHYHFLVREDVTGDKSRFFQRLFNSYTQAYNCQQRRTGTLFESRMKVKVVEDDAYAYRLIRYIHLNPVRAGLVSDALDWEFSSHAEWLGHIGLQLCHEQQLRTVFARKTDYLEFMFSD